MTIVVTHKRLDPMNDNQGSDEATFNVMTADVDSQEVAQDVSRETVEQAQTLMLDALPDAVRTIIHLSRHADNEKLRFEAARFITQQYVLKPGDDPTQAWDDFFKALHGSRKPARSKE